MWHRYSVCVTKLSVGIKHVDEMTGCDTKIHLGGGGAPITAGGLKVSS